MTFLDAVSYVTSLEGRGWRLGLDRMSELVRRAGLQDATGAGPKFIHVAGTNGKGSVTAYAQSILLEAGHRIGGYFSPFVYDVRERIQVDGAPIGRREFAELVRILRPVAESFDGSDFGSVTEFEFKTAMGLACWKRNGCESVALEVGMGGRLDATNVVTPACSVIVSIGLDHTQYLGSTYEEIAREKAGIIKAGKPSVVGNLPPGAMSVVRDAARAENSSIWELGREIKVSGTRENLAVCTPLGSLSNLSLGMAGTMQPGNLALAIAAIHASGLAVDDEAVRRGASKARLPGRFEVRAIAGMTIVLDGAHNADAARCLRETFASEFAGRKAVLVTGMVGGHNPSSFYEELAPIVRAAHVAPIDSHRALAPEEIVRALADCGIGSDLHSSVPEALSAAMKERGSEEAVLVTGSFYLVGEAGNGLRKLR